MTFTKPTVTKFIFVAVIALTIFVSPWAGVALAGASFIVLTA